MLKNINQFSLDRKDDPEKINKDLLGYIENFVEDKNLNQILNWISKETKVSLESYKCDSKLFIFNQFENINGKFNNKFKFYKLFFSTIKFILVLFYIRVFSTKKIKIQKFKLVIDDVDEFVNIDRYLTLNKLIDLILITKIDISKNFNYFKFSKGSKFLRNKDNKNNFKFIFNALYKTLILSINSKTNITPIISSILFKYFKYETIFSNIKSEYLLQERHYNTSAIKNEIFKKKGGRITASIQKNLIQLNGPGMFINCDLLLTLGKKSAENLKNYQCNVQKKIPVGSLFMESHFFTKNNQNSFPVYDLISFESNQIDTKFHSINENYFQDMYTHFEWIKKLSLKFPELKIGLKHKKTISDKKEIEMFKNSKNVSHLVNLQNETDSYHLGTKAKALCTWTSTLGYEFIGHGKDCLYLDPGGRNTAFLRNSKENSKIRVTDYEEFESKIINLIKNNTKIVEDTERENYCLESSSVSQKIIKAFEQF